MFFRRRSGTAPNKQGYGHLFPARASQRARYAPELDRLALAAASKGGVYIDTEVLSSAERREVPFYRDIIQPQGIRSQIGVHLTFQGRRTAILYLCRHGRGKGFRHVDADRLLPTLPALGLAHAAVEQARPTGSRLASMDALTARERQIVAHLGSGFTNREIAAALGTSPNTVRNQLTAIYDKVGASGRTELAVWIAGLAPDGERST